MKDTVSHTIQVRPNKDGSLALSVRALWYLKLTAEGLTQAQIARRVRLSEASVSRVFRSIHVKLGSNDAQQALWLARRAGFDIDSALPPGPVPSYTLWTPLPNSMDYSEMMISVGIVLRQVRLNTTNLKLADVADECGVSVSLISRLERGNTERVSTNVDHIFAVCMVLGVPPSDVFRAAEERTLGPNARWRHRVPGWTPPRES